MTSAPLFGIGRNATVAPSGHLAFEFAAVAFFSVLS